jgi:hypothetical protein
MLSKLGTRNIAGIAATILVIGLAAAGVSARAQNGPATIATDLPEPTTAPLLQVNDLPPYTIGGLSGSEISRTSDLYTIIPTRPRLGLLKSVEARPRTEHPAGGWGVAPLDGR